jgi:hypothetical protein
MKFARPGLGSILAAVLVTCVSAAQATESGDIEGAFRAYWSNYSSQKFGDAAGSICSEELALLKSDLLPVFLTASSSSESDARGFAKAFFADIPPSERNDMSGRDVFVHLAGLIAGSDPSLSHLNEVKVENVHVSIDADDSTQATLKVEMVIGDVSVTDMNEAKKTGGVWCLLLKEKPMATALKFRRLFHL